MIQHALQPPIPFLAQPPAIDGILTPEKAQLSARRFAHTFKMDPGNPDFDLSYRLAYGADFFYLYIQVDAETFTCRDRGFQNGDGFVLTLARPQPENAPSPQFTTFGFWPQEDAEQPLARLLWGRNGEYPFIALGADTQFVVKAYTDKARAGVGGSPCCLPLTQTTSSSVWARPGLTWPRVVITRCCSRSRRWPGRENASRPI